MKLTRLLLLCLLLPAVAVAAAPKKAAEDEPAQAIPAPKENRIVRYTYSPDVIFRILTVTNLHTHIELADDEGAKEVPQIGDSVQWRVSGGPRNIYLKPLRPDLETSMTIVTNKRTYQFQLISGKRSDSPAYQKLSFVYPDREAEFRVRKDGEAAALAAEQTRLDGQIIARGIDPTALDFGFEIVGRAPFKPLAVYSDGKFTYLRMPQTQDSPAVILIDDEGNPSSIEYKVRENLIVVERVIKQLLLKLGNAEVRVLHRSGGDSQAAR
jgi:P-type conjugative transfer protein VirB9